MVHARLLIAVLMLTLSAAHVRASASESHATPADARARVAHHLRHAEHLVVHFEALVAESCPRFPSADGWDRYIDAEADRLVLLVAHLEQAWIEAKRTPDDDVRRAAKAPRRQVDQARQLLEKFNVCAEANGAAFAPHALWRRVERDVPRRQAEIALPQ